MIVPADCEMCGACCSFDTPTYVPLNTEDQRLLGAGLGSLTHELAGEVYMRMDGGFCAALDRSQGKARCSIYSRRPELCRDFRQGSPECRTALVGIRRR